MEQQGWNDRANKILGTVKVFAKWLLLASVVGVVVGLMGVLFHVTVEKATELRMELPWLLYLLPLGGVAIVLLYQKSGMEKDMGTNTIIQAVRGENPLRFRTAPLIFISTVLTHLLGGSSGREGAALQIGGSVGARLADGFSLNQQDHQIMIMCGMSTCFAALFGTPLTATIFAIEVISVGVMHYSALVPCLTGSLIGYGIASSFGIAPTAFDIGMIPALGPVTVIQVILLSVLCAVVSALYGDAPCGPPVQKVFFKSDSARSSRRHFGHPADPSGGYKGLQRSRHGRHQPRSVGSGGVVCLFPEDSLYRAHPRSRV